MAADNTTSHMFIITIADCNDGRKATVTGNIDVWPGESRLELHTSIHEKVSHDLRYRNSIVLFFSLEPDAL